MEIIYPNLPFYPAIDSTSTLPQFIAYWFGFAITIAIAIAVISLIIAGIQLMTSAGNTGATSEAKDKIKGATLGLVLLLSSFLILRTINPVLVTPSLTSLGEVPGVFYTNGTDDKPAPISESNTANIPQGYSTIIYKCAVGAYSPNLYIWKFPKTNFRGNDDKYEGVVTAEKKCGEKEPVGEAGSFRMAFKTPGIYYFLGDNCQGYMSGPNLSDQDTTEPFRANIKQGETVPTGNIRSIKVVNDKASSAYFGIIFHQQSGVEKSGLCDIPRLSDKDEECLQIYDSSNNKYMQTNAATIFQWSKSPIYSGTGIDFYSDPYGWAAGSGSGYYTILKSQLAPGVSVKNTGEMTFSYQGIKGALSQNCQSKPSCSQAKYGQECCPCKTLQNCLGSMKVRGKYLIALYSAASISSGLSCQIFYKDVPNFKVTEISIKQGSVNYVNIIPLK
ncbi:MAG: hypothetical protein AAB509_00745 [Patescibacteria group bacterium]